MTLIVCLFYHLFLESGYTIQMRGLQVSLLQAFHANKNNIGLLITVNEQDKVGVAYWKSIKNMTLFDRCPI